MVSHSYFVTSYVWSNEWAKKSFSLKEKERQGYLFKTGQNFFVCKAIIWSAYVLRTSTVS